MFFQEIPYVFQKNQFIFSQKGNLIKEIVIKPRLDNCSYLVYNIVKDSNEGKFLYENKRK